MAIRPSCLTHCKHRDCTVEKQNHGIKLHVIPTKVCKPYREFRRSEPEYCEWEQEYVVI
jgi:hypothetical protein